MGNCTVLFLSSTLQGFPQLSWEHLHLLLQVQLQIVQKNLQGNDHGDICTCTHKTIWSWLYIQLHNSPRPERDLWKSSCYTHLGFGTKTEHETTTNYCVQLALRKTNQSFSLVWSLNSEGLFGSKESHGKIEGIRNRGNETDSSVWNKGFAQTLSSGIL